MHTTIAKLTFLLLSGSLLLTACGGANEAELEQEAWDDVMRVHDEAMPLMSDLNSLKVDLRAYLEGDGNLDETLSTEIQSTITQLTRAQESMMAWMNQLEKPLDGVREGREHEAVMEYLRQEQAEIETIQSDMNQALNDARQLLDRLGSDG